ncbi:ribosome biogenesis GTPase Der [Thiohalophilus thiocyanatoxydans]|uniref:GTPase Der n=1 Tax=Thiohalophilus thiocyanatoxydans TaxID=381308 RepID=A0A4R8ILR0_9GAMM|nr:ribosome biogenesis GTPase Der [Thiohalophilus thiocyanatoxydans]TDY01736.1 GTP-binding protein [Thiohalophilus thiocyanatoxydans]
MQPVIALVGRPNVGKSTLFNKLTRSRDALVADQPGLTRDRQFGEGKLGDKPYIVVDTGGLSGEDAELDSLMASQSWLAVEQADIVLFMVDARAGLLPDDHAIAERLRQSGKTLFLVVNKVDGTEAALATAEFHALGLGEPYAIAASQGRGIKPLMEQVLAALPDADAREEGVPPGIKVAIIGRPNVGKSTLANRILGEERVLAYDSPGTTRDSIYLPFERDGQHYVLIDTAGVRRRSRVKETVEKFSVIKTLQAVKDAHVVLMLLDAHQGISDQDASLLGFVLESGRALVLGVNKWDGLEKDQRDWIRREIDAKLPFLSFAEVHFISALHGTNVGHLFASITTAYESATRTLSTASLTRLLQDLVEAHPPPMVRGRRIKLRFAHQGGQNPPVIIIHGNQTASVPDSYRRYLINGFQKHLGLEGTPVQVELRSGDNPFAGKKNKLTARQLQKRQRLRRFVTKRGK